MRSDYRSDILVSGTYVSCYIDQLPWSPKKL